MSSNEVVGARMLFSLANNAEVLVCVRKVCAAAAKTTILQGLEYRCQEGVAGLVRLIEKRAVV
jgi:hypothetical protein